MKKLSILFAILIVLATVCGCSKRTANDLATESGTESETFEFSVPSDTDDITESVEPKNTEQTGEKAPIHKESTDTKNADNTTKPIDTEKEEETKGAAVNPEPTGNTNPSPEGGNSTPTPANNPGGNSTSKAPEATKQPAETTSPRTPTPASTTKQTEESTPAPEPKPESDPNLPATVKVYSLNGGNVAVVNVKNNTGHNCSVEVRGTYKKADGSAIRTETKTFSGLSAGDDNYFIFNPGITFVNLMCETKEIKDGAPGYSGLLTFETTEEMEIAANMLPVELGEEYLSSFSYPCAPLNYSYSGAQKLYFSADWIVFDRSGKPLHTGVYRGAAERTEGNITCKVDIKCGKSGDKYVLPDYLKGELSFIVALTSITEKSPY